MAGTSPGSSVTTRRGPKPETVAKAAALGVTVPEAIRLGQRINTALINLTECNIYFSPKHRCVIARSTSCTRRFRLPEDALLVGHYAHGVQAVDVLADLAELLARAQR